MAKGLLWCQVTGLGAQYCKMCILVSCAPGVVGPSVGEGYRATLLLSSPTSIRAASKVVSALFVELGEVCCKGLVLVGMFVG